MRPTLCLLVSIALAGCKGTREEDSTGAGAASATRNGAIAGSAGDPWASDSPSTANGGTAGTGPSARGSGATATGGTGMATPTDGTGGTLSVTSDSADNVTVNGTSGPVEQGSGVSKKDARSVGIYSRIAFSGTIRGEVTIEAGHSVEISGDDNIVPLIETVVEDGVLWIRPTKSMAPKTPLVATIKTTSLAGIVVDGANTVSVRGISGDLFAIDAHGTATVTAVGAAKRAEIELDGAGTIDASELKAGDVTVTAAGTGDIDVSATGVLDVTITGTAKVRYRGKPRDIRQQITGVGSLEAK